MIDHMKFWKARFASSEMGNSSGIGKPPLLVPTQPSSADGLQSSGARSLWGARAPQCGGTELEHRTRRVDQGSVAATRSAWQPTGTGGATSIALRLLAEEEDADRFAINGNRRLRRRLYDDLQSAAFNRLKGHGELTGHCQSSGRRRGGQRGRAHRRVTAKRKILRSTEQIYRARAGDMADRHNLVQKSAKIDIDAALDKKLLSRFLAGEGYTKVRLLFYASCWHWHPLNTDLRGSDAARLGNQSRTRGQTLLRAYQLAELSSHFADAQLRCRVGLGFSKAFDCYRRSGGEKWHSSAD